MAIIPKESIFASQTVKPTAFAVWCLLCQVKDSRKNEVYLELETAVEAGIQKSAYYSAFVELEAKGWIRKSESKSAKKMWILVKGFSANVENSDAKNSANVEKNSINTENFSANVEFPLEPPIRINSTKGIRPKELDQREREKPPARKLSVDEVLEIENRFAEKENSYPEFEPTKAIEIWSEVFPNVILEMPKLKSFAERLPEVEESVWRQTLIDWRDVGWKGSNFVGIIERYQKKLGARNGSNQNFNQNGNNKPSNIEQVFNTDYSEFAGEYYPA